jgi:mRNA interferase YafQ
MLKVERHKQFVKDLKKIKLSEQHYAKYIVYLSNLIQEKNLPDEAHDHELKGSFSEYREFHVSGDLLIVYMIKDETLKLIRIGSHSEIFN